MGEYSAAQIQRIFQRLFPQRSLVLSQFTFFNHAGLLKPSGATFRRGRQCYRLPDLLPVACVLALKEEGIPYKNIESVPVLLQEHSEAIFRTGPGCRIAGFGSNAVLTFPGQHQAHPAIESFLSLEDPQMLFWSFDVGALAQQISEIVVSQQSELQKAA